MAEIIKEEDFDEKVLKSDKPVMVDFFATWCGPCKMIAGEVDETARQMEGKGYVYKLDIDECDAVLEKYSISCVPTLIFFKDGSVFKVYEGAYGKEAMLEVFEEMLK